MIMHINQINFIQFSLYALIAYKSRYNLEAIIWQIINILVQNNNNVIVNMLFDTIKRKNMLGQALCYYQSGIKNIIISNTIKNIGSLQINDINVQSNLFISKLIKKSISTKIVNTILYQQQRKITLIKLYLKQFEDQQFKKPFNYASDHEFIDVDTIQVCLQRNNKSSYLKLELVRKIYDSINENIKPLDKYTIYQIIQVIILMTNEQLTIKLNLKQDNIDQIVQMLLLPTAETIKQLDIKAYVTKFLDKSHIQIRFQNTLQVDDLQSQTLLPLFINIENRLQIINGTKCFMLLRNTSNNRIHKYIIPDESSFYENQRNNNYIDINKLLKECSDNELYDVVIQTKLNEWPYDNLSSVRIQYLNYINWQVQSPELYLSHPEDLVSATLLQVRINSINQFINLKNIYSVNNIYSNKPISGITALKRVFSVNDTYLCNNCFLIDLITSNQLQYLSLISNFPDNNIIKSSILSTNIRFLRAVKIYQEGYIFELVLNIQNELPKYLRVFDVKCIIHHELNEEQVIYGQIRGNEGDILKIKQQLIHRIE